MARSYLLRRQATPVLALPVRKVLQARKVPPVRKVMSVLPVRRATLVQWDFQAHRVTRVLSVRKATQVLPVQLVPLVRKAPRVIKVMPASRFQ